MNNGRICISICAKTADELFEKLARAEPLADVIEVRFDCIEEAELEKAVGVAIASDSDVLATFRPAEQGGHRQLTRNARADFWNSGTDINFWGGDFELDVVDDSFYWLWGVRICSFHDFTGEASNPASIYDELVKTGAGILKIAIRTDNITDAIPLWQLSGKSRSAGKEIIPIAMGEAGKWTRILGLAHGAFMTYAALDEGDETAPGQITAEDLINVYRVKQLGRETGVYGIIAGDTSYSMSPYIQNAAFRTAGMDRVFVPLQVADLGEFMRRMVLPATREVDLNFRGFAVTNPHKQGIVEYMDETDDTAKAIGAVNTVKIDGGKLYGHNTDAAGFIGPLQKALGDLAGSRAAVFGAGGAARACVYSLKQAGADLTIYARDIKKARSLAEEFECASSEMPAGHRPLTTDILVNATPLGTRGEHENETVAAAEQLSDVKLVYDLTYNPEETRLIREAKLAGCKTLGGLDMLIGQAVRQFEIWTGETPSREVMETAARRRLSK
jgi:3-dehydroquinate dehydratase/shikimate dehydrogenase